MAKQIQDSIGRLHETEQECARKIEQAEQSREKQITKAKQKAKDLLDNAVHEAETRKKELLTKYRATIQADVDAELKKAQTKAARLKKAALPRHGVDELLATIPERYLKDTTPP